MKPRITVEFDVAARMRDGVQLLADVYRPDSPSPWPTLLTRTPYDKGVNAENVWSGLDPVRAARRGFMVVVQDVRGRFASEGEWDPLRFEREDGFDSVEWAAKLLGSNGQVGLYGGSYCGNTQWMAAIERPPSLAAISPLMTWSEPTDGLLSRGGAVELGLDLAWSLLTGADWIGRVEDDEEELLKRAEAIADEWDRLGEEGYWGLPVAEIPALARHAVPELGSIRALADPKIAARSRVAGNLDRVQVPSFHTGGWHDIFLQGTLDNYTEAVAHGQEARLVVGPWSHERFADPIGEQLFGVRSGRDGVPVHPHGDWNDFQLAWLRSHLVADAEVELPDAPVRIFVMGRNEWRDEPAWPLERAVEEQWFLRADGSLGRDAPADDGPSEFVYDPADPVPTVGGHTVMWPGFPAGPMDQASVEARDDVQVFTSEPLREDLEVTGRVRVVLHAESSALSTDWVARLCDVGLDGRSFTVCDGILRVEDGAQECGRHEIDLWSTSNVFLRGHRLRVQVTSSCFPRWDRNLNTGRQGGSDHEVARQRIFHRAERPSFIELPVVR
jgi:putative CocE/NonD family hydrolase